MAAKLAIDGGERACRVPWPERANFGVAEKQAVMRLFDKAIKTGRSFGYNGPEEEAYCREFSDFLGGGYADAVNSGSSAVYVALKALRIKAFTEVICGPVSDPGGIMPIALAGCIPIVADSAPGSFNVGADAIEKRLNRRTSAIVVAHISGLPADMGPIMEIARAKNIPVIEDCAQAHGAKYRGRCVGAIGDVAAFSTMHGKHHATGGQGGVVFTRDEETYWLARRYSDRGKPFNLEGTNGNVVCSHNMNLSDLAACIGRVQLRKLPTIVKRRGRIARFLINACKKELKSVRIVEGLPRTEPVWWFIFAQLDLDRLAVDKKTFVRALSAEGVRCSASYLHLPTQGEWCKERRVFEGTGYPWTCPLYKGNPDREYSIPNILATNIYTFRMDCHERVPLSYAKGVVAALKKVETAYLK